MLKDHYCGELGKANAGERVRLAGWVHRRRDHGRLIFVDLRDSRGIVQVVVNPSHSAAAHAVASELRNEFVVQVNGTVQVRRPGTENPDLATGDIEVLADELVILNRSLTPPFYINEDTEVDELLRIRYRYLDLRRPSMQRNLQLRHRVALFMREFLNARGFLEIETPVLIKSTPEGARDYLVPSRVHPGNFYALPQSPQQLKQLLMVAGFERYFQIAHCFRDEDLRADRQPEFTQLDLEMSFVDQPDILDLIEDLYTQMVRELTPQYSVPTPWPRMTYQEAMERFGSDKPDLRYGLEIRDFSAEFAETSFNVFKSALESGGRIRGLSVPGGAAYSRRQIDELTEIAKSGGARGLVSVALQGEGALDSLQDEDVRSPVKQYLPLQTVKSIAGRVGAGRGDLILIVADQESVTSRALDLLRREIAERQGLADPRTLAFLWVVDFPLFEWDSERGRWDSAHHPFTSPKDEDRHLLDTDPGKVRSKAYDIVCNGWEIGSGSIRIHERDVQAKIFGLLGISEEEQQERFGHMLEAFEYGAPPHGGIAPGLDRTVALLAGERDIREVIAFPKTKSATDPMTGAPSPVDPKQLADLGLQLREVTQRT